MLLRLDWLLGRTAAIVGGVLLAIPLWSVVSSPIVPLALRLLLTVLWLLAIVRPRAALLGLALLVPFGTWFLLAVDAAPLQYTEAVVLATISGLLLASARGPRAATDAASPSLGRPALIFATVIVCSLAVVLAVSQVGIGMRWLFFSNIATFLVRDYLVGAPGPWTGVAAACQLLEGVGLLLLVIRWTSWSVVAPMRMMQATAAAAVAAAALSLTQLVRIGLILATSMRDLLTRLLISRVTEHVTDLNAGGSHYAMAGFITLGLAWHERERGRLGRSRAWGAATAVLAGGMWISGSRTAVVACALVFIVAAIVAGGGTWRKRPIWLIAAGTALACVAGALIFGFDPRAAVAGRSLAQTFESRAAFITTGVRMIASAPIFGVGIGRYFEMSGRFMPQSIYWFFFHENAHNNFLQIGGELGLLGLAAFLWVLGAVALRVTRGLRASAGDRLLAGAFAGLAAFVATWVLGHPLLSPEVAFPFWIAAGAAVARADGNRRTPLVPEAASPSHAVNGREVRLLSAAAMLLLIASVPLRARREAATLNLAEQSFGFYAWEGDPAAGGMRWTSPSAGFFIPAQANEIDLPMRASFSERRHDPTVVRIAIDGRVFDQRTLTNGDVFTLRLRLPIPAVRGTEPRRVDIITTTPWTPAELLGTHDTRVLGVQLGQVITR